MNTNRSLRIVVVAAGFLLAIGFLLFTEHRAHVIAFLPWLILLACPLMHLFMHGGHGDHDSVHPSPADHTTAGGSATEAGKEVPR